MDDWDIERDLPFLIATDEQLEGELDHVCSLLLDSPSDSTTQPNETGHLIPTPQRKASTTKTPGRNRRRHEILELRRQVKALKKELINVRHQAAMQNNMSTWEKAARAQLYHKQKAIQENELLRETTRDNSLFIAKMKTFLHKKPRSNAELSSEDWQEYKLAASASLRVAGIHAIADRQYTRLDTVLINAGLFGVKDSIACVRPKTNSDGKGLYVEQIYCVNLDAPRENIINAIWSFCKDGQLQCPLPSDAQQVIEIVDQNTLYEMYKERSPAGVFCHSNMIRKLYVEEHRHIILSRTVLHDALSPHMVHGDVEDESSWIVVEDDELNPTNATLRAYSKAKTISRSSKSYAVR
ncbi:hypothetical protein LEN26_003687 [Aphanomyces euteiches]|nr:hypothetical protein AeMF1_014499 [Aphanomyces euteiches]KAH9152680.1 hypothetical protein LEN26_003687 [Aphanomyces euteiches]KAH9196836.1 hypothetical protein AeNC1_001217 [Aphanomyces euteiches]